MLIVAHRLATVKHCDEIIVMDKGEILERGTHEQLLAKRGKYFEMWQLQQGEFIKERRPIPEYLESNANTNYGINYEDLKLVIMTSRENEKRWQFLIIA